jgi:ABC-type nitrate/sulfonate/bicarbonate transport system permease component
MAPVDPGEEAAMKGLGARLRMLTWEAWLPVVLLAIWWVTSAGSASPYFPGLSEIASRFGELWLFEHVVIDLVPSLARLGAGFSVAVVVGLGLGIVLGLSPRLEVAVRPVLEFVRATPGVALLPIVMIFFGTGTLMKIVMIALLAAWPILLNTIDGVRSVEPILKDVAATFRMPYRHQLRWVVLPAAAPQIIVGARLGLSVGVIVMVVAEMFGTPGGIGYFILHAQRSFDLVDMWTGIIALGIVGYLLNNLFRLVERTVLRWQRNMISQGRGAAR